MGLWVRPWLVEMDGDDGDENGIGEWGFIVLVDGFVFERVQLGPTLLFNPPFSTYFILVNNRQMSHTFGASSSFDVVTLNTGLVLHSALFPAVGLVAFRIRNYRDWPLGHRYFFRQQAKLTLRETCISSSVRHVYSTRTLRARGSICLVTAICKRGLLPSADFLFTRR